MRSAAIDVGSNTIRMLIADVRDNVLHRIFSARRITRLAEGVRDSGILRRQNLEESVSVLKGFSSSSADYGAGRVSAVGTSALRDARNSQEFVDAVFRDTGIRIRTISGLEEAELTAEGILLGFGGTDIPLFIIDIGGGSTEWIIHDPAVAGTSVCGTMPVGVINILERFVNADPVSADELRALNSEIGSHLERLHKEVMRSLPKNTVFVGTGGTVTTLACLDLGLKAYDPERIHMHRISLRRLEEIRDMLVSLPLSIRKEINGLEPGRADLIIPGILLTIKFMEFFGFCEITVSDYGLLEGLLREADK